MSVLDRVEVLGRANGTGAPVVSIIINNYNYAPFLRDAIESALNQTYPQVEVIIVDDGSTDNSRQIIAEYADRATVVLKENGGQASAFNRGFAASSGDVVIFLDSDDLLDRDIAERVAREFELDPGLAKVQYRLRLVDAQGNPLGGTTPPENLELPSGDLRKRMLRFPDDVRTPPTSGNAFARAVLEQILPMPETPFGRVGADLHLFNLTPLYGRVKSLPGAGGAYRSHGSNHFHRDALSLAQVRKTIRRSNVNHRYLYRHARRLGFSVPAHPSDILSVTFIVNRVASLKLDPLQHPIQDDSAVRLLWLGVKASLRRFDLPLRVRAVYMAWFAVACLAPSRFTERLVGLVFFPHQRRRLGRLV